MTNTLPVSELHKRFLARLNNGDVLSHSCIETKPIEIDMVPPLPTKVRLYMYNATKPPGGRTVGEHKIQLIVPGQQRGERANFDSSEGRIVLLAGYEPIHSLFIFWDGTMYPHFSYSMNAQVMPETIYRGFAHGIASQERARKGFGKEMIVVCEGSRLKDGLILRMNLTRKRLLGND